MAVHCLYPHALGGGLLQGLGELWMGAAVGGEIADALHLDDEQHTGPEALLLAADQLPQVFDPRWVGASGKRATPSSSRVTPFTSMNHRSPAAST